MGDIVRQLTEDFLNILTPESQLLSAIRHGTDLNF